MTIDETVAEHYGGSALLDAIEAGLGELGKSPATANLDDLAPVEEFHIGGRPATKAMCDRLEVTSETELLDIGCGIGGTTRFVAATYGCRATGLDLTPAYVEVGRTLTVWTGLQANVSLEIGSALDMPFADSAFDVATQLHVGMNIADKAALFVQANRVLRPGGTFGIYDVMRTTHGDLTFPVPWASDASASFVADLPTYRRALEDAGFEITQERNRRDFALEFFARARQRAGELAGPPPIGLHLILGDQAQQKVANMIDAVTDGIIAPVELICTKRT